MYVCTNTSNSVYTAPSVGPTFGGNTDFQISNQCDKNNSSVSYFPSCYNNGNYQSNQNATVEFIGQISGRNFKVKEYEVFEIII